MNVERIFYLREKNEFLQKEIADKLNISQQMYSFWEKGERIIPLKHLNTLCNFYNVSMDYMLGLTNTKKITNITKISVLDKKVIGQRLKKVRQDNNLTLRSMAKELNTTSSTISAYETGKNLILTAFAYQICDHYNISMDWLCGRCENVNKV